MQAFLTMLENVAIFVALAIPGFILVKCKILDQSSSKPLSMLLSYVGVPFFVIKSTLSVSITGVAGAMGITCGLAILIPILLFFLSALFTLKMSEEKKRGMLRFGMIFANNGFLGIPLAEAVFGTGSTVLAFVIIFNIINNVMLYTMGTYLVSGDKSNMSIKKALLNPVVIAFILAIILNVVKINDYVPQIYKFSANMAGLVTPLSMTILGIKMAGVKFTSIFTSLKMYYASLIKLVISPVFSVGVIYLFSLFLPVTPEMILATFIAFAMPTAGLSSTFADQYDGDSEGAVIYTLGTTILAVVAVPLLYALLRLIV